MEQLHQPHRRLPRLLQPFFVSLGAITFLTALVVSSFLWIGAAEANPNPSTTPSVAPTPGASGLYMFTNSSGFTKELRQINTTNGDASLAFPTTTTQNLKGVAQDPVTGIVWVVTGNCNLFTVDMTTGALSPATPATVVLPSPYSQCESLAIDGSQVFYLAMSNTSVSPTQKTWGTVDSTTGVATVRWNPGTLPSTLVPLSYDPVTQSVYYYAVFQTTFVQGWYQITSPSTVVSTSSSIGVSALALTPSGVAYNGAVDRAANISDFLTGVDTFVGYPNSQTAYNYTLFWYQAPTPAPSPTTPAPSPSALADTGLNSVNFVLSAGGVVFLGFVAVAVGQVFSRRKQ